MKSDEYYECHVRSRNCWAFTNTCVHPQLFFFCFLFSCFLFIAKRGLCCSPFYCFVLSYYMFFTFWVLCCGAIYDFCIKPCLVCINLQLFALLTLCVLVFSIVVHNTYCVVLLFCFCSSYVPNFASFSSFSFFIFPSVFSNEYYVNDKKNAWYMIATYIKSKIMLCLSPARTCKRCLSYLICLFYYLVCFLAIYWFILYILWYIVGFIVISVLVVTITEYRGLQRLSVQSKDY